MNRGVSVAHRCVYLPPDSSAERVSASAYSKVALYGRWECGVGGTLVVKGKNPAGRHTGLPMELSIHADYKFGNLGRG